MRLKASLILTLTLLVALLFPGSATAQSPSVGVTGETSWYPEFQQTLKLLSQDLGLPVHDGCGGDTICVHLSHYDKLDGLAGWSTGGGIASIHLNNYYDHGPAHRRTLLAHEFGHVLGLDHSDCSSSMNHEIPMCGKYVIGYNASEQQQLHQRWG